VRAESDVEAIVMSSDDLRALMIAEAELGDLAPAVDTKTAGWRRPLDVVAGDADQRAQDAWTLLYGSR
jgi:hypothetical protein